MILRVVQRILLITGIFLLLFSAYLFWQRVNPYRLSFAVYSEEIRNPASVQIHPVRVRIPSVSIDLPVFSATIENGKWPAPSMGVSYLSSSPTPGEEGNSILYGHNWPNLFGPLKRAEAGDTIEIALSDGEIRTFAVVMTDTVTPDQTHILSQSDDVRLTLYTCAGFLDRKRLVVTAVPL